MKGSQEFHQRCCGFRHPGTPRTCSCSSVFWLRPRCSRQSPCHLGSTRRLPQSSLVCLSVIECNWASRLGKEPHCSRLDPPDPASSPPLQRSAPAHLETLLSPLAPLSLPRPCPRARITPPPSPVAPAVSCSFSEWSSSRRRCPSTLP